MQDWLIHLTTSYPYLVYGIIAFISLVEGPWMALLCGLLLRLGDFPFMPLYVALMIGDLIGDSAWYWIGYRYGHRFIARFGKYFSITDEGVAKVTRIFHHYKNSILFISKITMGLGFAVVTLMTAGIVRIPFKRYIGLNVLGQFIWTGLLLSVGYFLGNIYVTFDNILGKLSLIGACVIIFFIFMGFSKYMRERMSRPDKYAA